MHSSFTSETTINYGKYSDTGYKGGLEGVKNCCLKMGCVPFDFQAQNETFKENGFCGAKW